MEEFAELYERALQSSDLLHSVYVFPAVLRGPEYSEYKRVLELHPALVEKLTKRFLEHPTTEISYSKGEQQLLDCIKGDAIKLAQDLQPAFELLQRVAKFQRRCERLMADLHQQMLPLAASMSPHLIQAYMEAFCNCCRITMLMHRVPWRTILQLYTICTQVLLQKDPPARSRLCEYIVACDNPVAMLQMRFQPITDRIKQVVEVVVAPTLQTACCADTLVRTSMFDVRRMQDNRMGVAGLSLEASYDFVKSADMYRQWALLGFLVCPRALHGVGAKQLLVSLLQESFFFTIHQDVVQPLHGLFGQLEGTNCGVTSTWLADVYEAAVGGADKEHKLRRVFITRCLEDMADLMEDEPSYQLHHLDMLLAASAYGRTELLWYMQHVGEEVPVPAKGAMPLFQAATAEVVEADCQVLLLLAALVRVYEGLAKYSPGMRAHHQETVRATVQQQLAQATAAICKYAQQGLGGTMQSLSSRGARGVQPRNTAPAPAALQALRAVVPKLQAVTEALTALGATAVGSVGGPPAEAPVPQSPMRPGTSTTAAGSPSRRQSVHGSPARGGGLAAVAAAAGAAASEQYDAEQQEEGEAAHVTSPQKCASPQRSQRPSATDAEEVAAADGSDALHTTAAGDCPPRESIVREWLCVVGSMSCAGSALRSAQLEMPAKDPCYISTINKMLDAYPYITAPLDALARHCSLEELALWGTKLQQLLSRALGASTPADVATLEGSMACIKALRWYGCKPPVPGVDWHGQAKRQGYALLNQAADALKGLVRDMVMCNDLCLPMVEAPLPPAPHLNLKKTTGIEDIEKKDKKQEKDQDSQTATPGSQPSSDTDAGQTRDAATQQQPVQQQEQSQEQQQAQEKPQPLLISSNCSTAPFTAATGIKASSHLRLLRASALARSMDACGWVRLCGEDAVCPWEWLREALRDSVQDLINGAAADQLNLPRPSQLAGRLQSALYAISALQEATSIHLLPEVWTALLLHAQPARLSGLPGSTPGSHAAADRLQEDDVQGSSSSDQGSARIMDLYAGWYLTNVLRDAGGMGVLYAPQLRCFSCVRQEGRALIQGHTSLAELTALLQVFGPYAAQVLASCCEQTMADCLQGLDKQLETLEGILWPVLDQVTQVLQRERTPKDDKDSKKDMRASCLPAVTAALGSMDPQAAVLNVSKTLGRCLAFRQLLADALLAAMQLESPLMALLPTAGVSTAAGVLYDPPRHIADVFQLPRPAKMGVGAPVTADPYVVRMLTGNNNHDRYRRWAALPVLLGLSLGSMAPSPSPQDLVARALDNDLHALGTAMQSLALAHQEAANKMLNCGSAFLHGSSMEGSNAGDSSQAGDMMAAFTRVATAVMYSGSDTPEVRTCKVVLLQGLAAEQTPAQLTAAWVPPSRLWSAMCPSLQVP